MQIVNDFPPNIAQIREVFPLKGREIFAWGDTIFNPSCSEIPPELIAHEEVHEKQQAGNPEAWWKRYLVDAEFRLEQELEAHQVEYRTYCKLNPDRNKRARYLAMAARRLAAPMYGGVIKAGEAMRRIKS